MKDRHTKTPLGLVCVVVFALAGVIAVTPNVAQAQDTDAHRVYDGCYVPQTGAVYIITDTLGACRSHRHVPFSFTYTDAHSLDADDGDPVDAVYVDHHGRVSTGYVTADSMEMTRLIADTVWSRGILIGDTYADVKDFVTTPLVAADSVKASLFVATDSVHVTGDVEVGGTVIAGAFIGDGSGLSNLNVQPGALDLVMVHEGPENAGTDGVVSLAVVSAGCPDGYFPMNAGYHFFATTPYRDKLTQTVIKLSMPSSDGSWTTVAYNPDPTFTEWSLSMSVICVRQAN